jgi:hypothetical protein
MNQHQIRQDAIQQYGDAPANALQALAHVVAVFADAPDDQVMIQATSNIYGQGVRTGLTMGDLRVLAAKLA